MTPQPKERPILFSAPMVRAILEGRKTQTRRVVKPQPPVGHQFIGFTVHSTHREDEEKAVWGDGTPPHIVDAHRVRCPYGVPGDRLWVRENGWERPERTPKMMREGADTWDRYYFDADGISAQEEDDFRAWGFKRRPSIHMPRWASRILLEVTGVRVERLQEISQADAISEGAPPSHPSIDTVSQDFGYADFSRSWFGQLYEQRNGPGSWTANPWVWVVEFRRIA